MRSIESPNECQKKCESKETSVASRLFHIFLLRCESQQTSWCDSNAHWTFLKFVLRNQKISIKLCNLLEADSKSFFAKHDKNLAAEFRFISSLEWNCHNVQLGTSIEKVACLCRIQRSSARRMKTKSLWVIAKGNCMRLQLPNRTSTRPIFYSSRCTSLS